MKKITRKREIKETLFVPSPVLRRLIGAKSHGTLRVLRRVQTNGVWEDKETECWRWDEAHHSHFVFVNHYSEERRYRR